MDVVYAFKETLENDSAELRYSLRSLRHIPHDNVYIIGEKPSWLTNAVHFPVPQDNTKYRNVSRNIQTAAESAEISDDFIFMNDDFFIMKSFDKMPAYHWGKMKDIIARFAVRYDEESEYMSKMKTLYEILLEKGFNDPMSYELHVPMVLNKKNIRRMYEPDFGRSYQFRTMYGNYFDVGGEKIEDVKVFLDPRHNDPEYQENPMAYLAAQSLLSATGGAFREGPVGDFIRSAFPDKSAYEL